MVRLGYITHGRVWFCCIVFGAIYIAKQSIECFVHIPLNVCALHKGFTVLLCGTKFRGTGRVEAFTRATTPGQGNVGDFEPNNQNFQRIQIQRYTRIG